MPMIFSESYLQRLLFEAERDAVNRVDFLFDRFSLLVTAGISTYELPRFFRKMKRVTWRGQKVDPITWQELASLAPSNFVPGYEYSTGVPKYYSLHPNNVRSIRFFPTPNENLPAIQLGLEGPAIADCCIISCYRGPEEAEVTKWQLPPYIQRRTTKAYAAWKAFAREGKGQNLAASEYYGDKLSWLYDWFSRINDGSYVSRRPRLLAENGDKCKVARPVLPPNFGTPA